MKQIDLNAAKDKLLNYFDISSFLIPQNEAEETIREGVSFRGVNLLVLILAIFIASLGLNVNSTAVIIGAMLISPLMGPIIGIGLAVGIQDFDLMKRSFRNLVMATGFSIATSCIYFLISPVNEGHSELLARTSPTIYDVLIGFFGGAAGIIAIGSKVKGNVIPGVAIATALMPPLCTVGYGLATWQMSYFLGALYLFFINSVFIACATTLGVKLMKYSVVDFSNPQRARKVRRTVTTIAVLTMIPAVYMTYNMYRENAFMSNCDRMIDSVFTSPDTQVLSHKAVYTRVSKSLTITLVGKQLPEDSLMLAVSEKLPYYGLEGTKLRIIQGHNASSKFDVSEASSTMLRDMYQVTQATINSQRARIDSLMAICTNYRRADSLSAQVTPELKVIFPQIRDIAVMKGVVSNVPTGRLDTVNIVLVQYSERMNTAAVEKFRKYMEARLSTKPLTIVSTNELSDSRNNFLPLTNK
ncbi:MAG: DUF389 domain-containing protein [Muribaculum sp.]|nr:DUF389 domain-containing protein [Muribaculum sp.]